MSKLRIFLLALLVIALTALPVLWYYGFVPIANGIERARLRHALNLRVLPQSLIIEATRTDAWTDYIFEADLHIDPERLPELLAGRDYKMEISPIMKGRLTQTPGPLQHDPFVFSEIWSWIDRPPNLPSGDYGTSCSIYINAAHDRVYLSYMTD